MVLMSLPFNVGVCSTTDLEYNTTPSIDITQQNLNTIWTEYQRMNNSWLPLTNSNNCVLEAHQLYSK